jgi:D-sedoheptulose 7-phosphate isomerase
MSTKKDLICDYMEGSMSIQKEIHRTLVPVISQIAEVIIESYRQGHKVVWFGNGGSAADAQHLACELVSRFFIERKALASIALTTNTSELTAIGNDYSFDQIFARQVEALVLPDDVVIGISTSGNSPNVIAGLKVAKKIGAITIAFTGKTGGKIAEEIDYLLAIPSDITPQIQEMHILIGHILCYLVEVDLFCRAKNEILM